MTTRDDGGDDHGSDADDMGSLLRQGIKSALARWVLAQRRARASHARSSSVTPRDEATHIDASAAFVGPRHFAEDYTFVGVCPGLGLVLRLEHLPGRDSQRVWVVILRPDGVWALRGGQLVARAGDGDRWSAGGLRLDCETPLRRWTLRFQGSLERTGAGAGGLRLVGAQEPQGLRGSIDLTFVSTARPHVLGTDDDPELLARRLGQATWDARLLRAARRERPRGYAQLGELHGTVTLGDLLVPVRAAALRQHQWGVRDWGACDLAYQCFHVTDDQRRGFVHHARFPFVTLEGGFGSLHGHCQPVRSLGATIEGRPRGAPSHASVVVGEADGTRTLELELVSELSFVVDGRGRVDLALMRIEGPSRGLAVWAGLQRTLPRPRER